MTDISNLTLKTVDELGAIWSYLPSKIKLDFSLILLYQWMMVTAKKMDSGHSSNKLSAEDIQSFKQNSICYLNGFEEISKLNKKELFTILTNTVGQINNCVDKIFGGDELLSADPSSFEDPVELIQIASLCNAISIFYTQKNSSDSMVDILANQLSFAEQTMAPEYADKIIASWNELVAYSIKTDLINGMLESHPHVRINRSLPVNSNVKQPCCFWTSSRFIDPLTRTDFLVELT